MNYFLISILLSGHLAALWFDSELIIMASVLMILVGFFILWMRLDNRRNLLDMSSGDVSFVERSKSDRRQSASVEFPLVDDNGAYVKLDRRVGNRRA